MGKRNSNVQFPVVINSRDELNDFLSNHNFNDRLPTQLSSLYFLIKYKTESGVDVVEPIYFFNYENSYFETSSWISSYKVSKAKLKAYVKDVYEESSFEEGLAYESLMYKNGIHHQLNAAQCFPFLTYPLEIQDVLSDDKCLTYFLNSDINSSCS